MSLLLVIPYAAIDRLWSSDVRHARLVSLCVLPACGYLLGGHYGMATAAAFLVVRSLPFRLFGGSATPTTARETLGLGLRYGLMIPLAASAAWMLHEDVGRAILAWTLWAVASLAISSWYGRENAKAQDAGGPINPASNVFVEALRGALAGVAAGVA